VDNDFSEDYLVVLCSLDLHTILFYAYEIFLKLVSLIFFVLKLLACIVHDRSQYVVEAWRVIEEIELRLCKLYKKSLRKKQSMSIIFNEEIFGIEYNWIFFQEELHWYQRQ